MARTLESNQRLIEPITLPVSSIFAPIARMARQPENDFMTPDVLGSLVGVCTSSSRSAYERQTDCLIVGFVRAVLTIRQDGGAKGPVLIRKIDPLVRAYLKLPLRCCWSLNSSHIPVVSCQLVRGRKWKGNFQICLLRFPVDDITKFDTIARVARRQANPLHKF